MCSNIHFMSFLVISQSRTRHFRKYESIGLLNHLAGCAKSLKVNLARYGICIQILEVILSQRHGLRTRTSDTCGKQRHLASTTVSLLLKCSLFSHSLCTMNTCTVVLRLRQRCIFPACVGGACRQQRVAVIVLVHLETLQRPQRP